MRAQDFEDYGALGVDNAATSAFGLGLEDALQPVAEDLKELCYDEKNDELAAPVASFSCRHMGGGREDFYPGTTVGRSCTLRCAAEPCCPGINFYALHSRDCGR